MIVPRSVKKDVASGRIAIELNRENNSIMQLKRVDNFKLISLEIIDKIECPVCFETKKGISQPKCSHFVCIDCFKRCYYGDDSGEPSFPYPDIEEEYFEDPENSKWDLNYPLIKSYDIEWETWENNNTQKYNDEENLRLCPLCRK
jgi:hypothetical protein